MATTRKWVIEETKNRLEKLNNQQANMISHDDIRDSILNRIYPTQRQSRPKEQ